MSNTYKVWNRYMPRSPTKSAATLRGQQDYVAGVSINECPYPQDTAPRKHWLNAYVDARTKDRLKQVYLNYPDKEA